MTSFCTSGEASLTALVAAKVSLNVSRNPGYRVSNEGTSAQGGGPDSLLLVLGKCGSGLLRRLCHALLLLTGGRRMGHHLSCLSQRGTQRAWTKARYSHSMVPGGFDVMSTVTRLISRTSLVIRVEIRSITS